jgi:hypothetical protein
MSVTSGGTAPKPCSSGGSWPLTPARAGSSPSFSTWNAAVAPPGPDRAFEVGVDHDAQEAVPRERDHARAAPPAPSGDWHRDRSSGRCAGPSDPRSMWWAILVREQVLRHDPVLELWRQPHSLDTSSRAAGSTRSHSAGLGPRSISQRPRISNVWASMMKMPGGPSVPFLPPPPSVLT